ncbi:hypothetical protein [Hyphomicrobium sp.]|uniref:hypothetical protein n=1 Tax=Hyphomicrobium sp. TaxID=82 RepID=UPI002E359971|nr:hypothetical protein [Hyphomicrobium sp.]HEX2841395.1 hypothetical protein [Hyphomicrobium sp.]
MSYKYTDDDVRDARPNALPIADTDVEISVGRQGDDVMLWVNKAGIQILRVRLKAAAKEISDGALVQFSSLSPDFIFPIGDSADGLARLKRSLGMVDDPG